MQKTTQEINQTFIKFVDYVWKIMDRKNRDMLLRKCKESGKDVYCVMWEWAVLENKRLNKI